MQRRDFINALAGGYSLAFFPRQGSAVPSNTLSAQAPEAGKFEALSPHSAPKLPSPEPHMRLVDLETDLLVAGGGLAGVCTAISAARHGARVILVQDCVRLGGNSSSEIRVRIGGADRGGGRPGWRESGLIEELRLEDAVKNPQSSWEMWDFLLYDKVVSEPNITLLLQTTLYAAETKAGRIQQVMARSDKTEHLYRIQAKMFCDTTGDCRLGMEAGADYRVGREARAEFNEPLGMEGADKETLGSSIMFMSRLHDHPMPFTPPKWARKVTKQDFIHRPIDSWGMGYWWIELGGDGNPIADDERIRFELLRIVFGIWDYIKNSGGFPSSQCWAMYWVGMMTGKRGSRRLLGDYIMTQLDVENGGRFNDAVAIGGWTMDNHVPEGFNRPDLEPTVFNPVPGVYNIPLRSLYSRNISNLFMAGRNISTTHIVYTSTRLMATASVMGQAVGTAAAQCIKTGITPRELASDASHLTLLQQALIRDDQTIKGMQGNDPADHARSAHITASGEIGAAKAALIQDGFIRDIPDNKGFPVEYHHWAAELPAWIQFDWDEPRQIREIQLTFDTGFQRELALRVEGEARVSNLRSPQPETVRDYTITAGGKVLASVSKNYQRVNRLSFDPTETKSLRVDVQAVNGIGVGEARIFDIRCYS